MGQSPTFLYRLFLPAKANNDSPQKWWYFAYIGTSPTIEVYGQIPKQPAARGLDNICDQIQIGITLRYVFLLHCRNQQNFQLDETLWVLNKIQRKLKNKSSFFTPWATFNWPGHVTGHKPWHECEPVLGVDLVIGIQHRFVCNDFGNFWRKRKKT